MELSNRLLSLAFDDRSGELTALRNATSGDEYLKRRPPGLTYQLAVTARAADGTFVTLLPPAQVDATVDQTGTTGGTVRPRYEHLLGLPARCRSRPKRACASPRTAGRPSGRSR